MNSNQHVTLHMHLQIHQVYNQLLHKMHQQLNHHQYHVLIASFHIIRPPIGVFLDVWTDPPIFDTTENLANEDDKKITNVVMHW